MRIFEAFRKEYNFHFSLIALHPIAAAAAADYGDDENGNVASPKDFCQRYIMKVLADP